MKQEDEFEKFMAEQKAAQDAFEAEFEKFFAPIVGQETYDKIIKKDK